MQEVFNCYSGPKFISGEIVRAKGTATMPPAGYKVPFTPYAKSSPVWPYHTVTMPHESGLLTENEKYELLSWLTAKRNRQIRRRR